MASNMWKVYSAAVPTTAAMVRIATGTAIKTHLQLTAPSNADLTIVSWGVSLEATPSAFVVAELIHTTTVAGTGMTAVTPSNLRGSTASAATAGFGPSAEGTVVATTRTFGSAIMTSSYFEHEWSLGREPLLEASQVLRIRLTTATTANALCWIVYE
jgi:hypothetical protein